MVYSLINIGKPRVSKFAKTLFMPTRPDHVDEQIKDYIKNKVPYFFINAKDKEENNVEKLNNSTVNRLEQIIPSDRINFRSVAGHFDYQLLLKNKNTRLDESIINMYTRLDRNKKWLMNSDEETKPGQKLYVYKIIKDRLLEVHNKEQYIVDVLVKHLYKKKSKFKATLWECFGDIMLNNLKVNLKDMKRCDDCDLLFFPSSNRQRLCEGCGSKREKEKTKERVRRFRSVTV
ncbi:hypothetical protein B4068_2122 [Bacillus subtilis]|nr:hypothetical protein B4068_2122 [Bacillus subtilis]